jgi:outer membrane protein assembly factor BamB
MAECTWGADSSVYALDMHTGEVQWRFEAEGGIVSSPAVARGTVYVGDLHRHVYALNAEMGEERWSIDVGRFIFSSPTIAGGTVCVGSPDTHLYAIDLKGATSVGVSKRGPAWRLPPRSSAERSTSAA